MTDRELNERLDLVAAEIRSADGRNAIHACRPGHPLGLSNPYKWRNAHFATVGRIAPHKVEWIKRRAIAEGI